MSEQTTASSPAAPRTGPRAPAATAAPASGWAESSLVHRYRWVILLGLITSAIMEVLDTTIINVALPQMAGNLGATMEEISWISTGYILSNVVVLPMTAFLTERFGRRNYLTISIIIFGLASLLCGTSTSLTELVVWRIIQGAGGAALLSTAQATVRQIFPREQQGMVQAIFLMGFIVAPTLGPTLGGWITDNYTWNWCFFINVPIAVVSAFIVSTFLVDPPEHVRHQGEIDWTGIALLALGVGTLQYVLEEGNRKDWFADATILRLAIVSAVSLLVMVWWELSPRNRHPVVNFRVLHNRNLAASIFLFVSLGFGLYGGAIIFPMFTQGILRFSPTETGLAMLPGGIGTAITGLICGRLLNGKRPLVDARLLIVVGIGLFLLSMWDLGHLTTAAGERDARLALLVRGFALGFLFTPINNIAYASLKRSEAQQASGLINLSRQLGGSFGIALLLNFVSVHTELHRVDLVSNIVAGSPETEQRMRMLEMPFRARGLPEAEARQRAYAVLDLQVQQQSAMLSYNDSWMLILWTFVLVSPAVLLLRPSVLSAGRGGGPPPDAH